MRRSLLFSCALHGVIVLIALATTPRPAPHEAVDAAEIRADILRRRRDPAGAIDVDVLAHAGGGGPTHPTAPAVVRPRARTAGRHR